MKISTKGRYGLRILLDLAQNATGRPRMIAEICRSQGLSQKYVGRLVIQLRRAGMISSVRGAKGGYMMKRAPENISLLEIIETMEGPLSIVNCVACPSQCKRAERCISRTVWCNLNDEIKKSFAKISLRQILDAPQEFLDYCI